MLDLLMALERETIRWPTQILKGIGLARHGQPPQVCMSDQLLFSEVVYLVSLFSFCSHDCTSIYGWRDTSEPTDTERTSYLLVSTMCNSFLNVCIVPS